VKRRRLIPPEPAGVPLLRVVLWHADGDDAAIMADVAIGEPPGEHHRASPGEVAAALASIADRIGPQIAQIWATLAADRN
jgi:hypothetical protein